MKKLIVVNWKSNKNIEAAREWLEDFKKESENISNEVVVCPPLPLLGLVARGVKELDSVTVGVQDISSYPAGSYTGAVSAHNLRGFKVKYAIVGHSERRRYFHETPLDVANKVEQCLENDITPIVCVDVPYLADQAKIINQKYLEQCVVAYETPSAIGTGSSYNESSPLEEVKEMVKRVRKLFGQVRVLYGGSINPKNYKEYYAVTDGAIIGTASLRVEEFVKLLR